MKCTSCLVEHGEAFFKFCPSCGGAMDPSCKICNAKIPDGSRFCPQCAAPVTLPQANNINLTERTKNLTPPKPGISTPPAPGLIKKQVFQSPPLPIPPQFASNQITAVNANVMSDRFARYWAKGVSGSFACWKYSNTSQAQAQQLANERVLQIAERFRFEKKPPEKYLYSDQKLREPVIREIENSIISRNAYGCLVLNTADIMFVDIDFPEKEKKGLLKSFFKTEAKDVQQEILSHIEDWNSQHREWGWRVYRTFAGLRLLATNGVYSPGSMHVHSVFEELGADPLYRVLCKVQKCFRARLTPKPWRIDLSAPSVRWPFGSEQDAISFENWERTYQQKSQNYATCHLVKVIGEPVVHPSVKPIIELHDKLTCVEANLPLA